jgi:hypothetical protein
MTTYLFYLFIKPLPNSKHYLKVIKAEALIFSVSDNLESAFNQCEAFLYKGGWHVLERISSNETTLEKCQDDEILLESYHRAQKSGCWANIHACSTDASGGSAELN